MNVEEIIKKAEANEGLTVEEIKIYQQAVKPKKHVYGKYGTLAKQYIELAIEQAIEFDKNEVKA